MKFSPIKFRLSMWRGMRIPFQDKILSFLEARWWCSWEDLINGAIALIQLPLAFCVWLFVLVPLITFSIAKNNTRIAWRFIGHVAYKLMKGKQK